MSYLFVVNQLRDSDTIQHLCQDKILQALSLDKPET